MKTNLIKRNVKSEWKIFSLPSRCKWDEKIVFHFCARFSYKKILSNIFPFIKIVWDLFFFCTIWKKSDLRLDLQVFNLKGCFTLSHYLWLALGFSKWCYVPITLGSVIFGKYEPMVDRSMNAVEDNLRSASNVEYVLQDPVVVVPRMNSLRW